MKKIFFCGPILILFSFVSLFLSCSDSTPTINSVVSSVIFQFDDETSFPATRISLFASTNEIQRVEQMRAINETTGLVWNIAAPRKFQSKDNVSWTGYTNLVPASGSSIPMGRYDLFYTDSAERECDANFYISYPKDYIEKKASDFPGAIQSTYTTNVALYTVDGSLLFYGKKKKTWSTNEMILKDYMLADTMRICYGVSNDSVIIMMPRNKIRQDVEKK